jgi:hypothetical protein
MSVVQAAESKDVVGVRSNVGIAGKFDGVFLRIFPESSRIPLSCSHLVSLHMCKTTTVSSR